MQASSEDEDDFLDGSQEKTYVGQLINDQTQAAAKRSPKSRFPAKECAIRCWYKHPNGSLFFCRLFRVKPLEEKKTLIKNMMFCSLCLASKAKNHQCSVQSCARCHAAHNVLLCPMDPPERSLLAQDLEEDGEDDFLDSYLSNTDQEAANLVMEEKSF